jgi:hypothetical protein
MAGGVSDVGGIGLGAAGKGLTSPSGAAQLGADHPEEPGKGAIAPVSINTIGIHRENRFVISTPTQPLSSIPSDRTAFLLRFQSSSQRHYPDYRPLSVAEESACHTDITQKYHPKISPKKYRPKIITNHLTAISVILMSNSHYG